jgi:hypothetical protein
MMSVYYVAKLFQDDPCALPDYLGRRRDGPRQDPEAPLPFGVVSMQEAEHFLWEEEASDALRRFMTEHGGNRIVRGQVFQVREDPVGPVVVAGEVPLGPASEPEGTVVTQRSCGIDIEEGEALVAAYEDMGHTDRPKRVMEARHAAAEWFLGNAEAIFEALKDYERLLAATPSEPPVSLPSPPE